MRFWFVFLSLYAAAVTVGRMFWRVGYFVGGKCEGSGE